MTDDSTRMMQGNDGQVYHKSSSSHMNTQQETEEDENNNFEILKDILPLDNNIEDEGGGGRGESEIETEEDSILNLNNLIPIAIGSTAEPPDLLPTEPPPAGLIIKIEQLPDLQTEDEPLGK